MSSFEKYLGLPTIIGANKAQSFLNLLDRVWTKSNNWKNNYLSAVGKKL